MDYLKIWDVILRRRRIVFYVFMSFFVPVVVATFVITKSYTAESRVLVKQSDNLNSILKNMGILTSITTSSSTPSYDTEVSLTTATPLLKKLISQLDLKDNNGAAMKPSDLITGKMKKMILPAPYVEAEQDEDADIVLITATAPSAQQAADVATATAMLFIEETKNRTSKEYNAAREAIESQVDKIKSDYDSALENLKNDMIEKQYVDFAIETQSKINAIDQLKSNLQDAERDIAATQKKEKELKQQLESTDKLRTEFEEYKENKQLADLKIKLNDKLVSIAGKAIEKRPDHPDYKMMESETEAAKKIIQQEVDLLLETKRSSVNPVYASLEQSLSQNSIDYMTAVAKKKIYTDYIAIYNKELLDIPVKKTGYQKLDLDLTLKKTNMSDLLSVLQKINVAEKLRLSNVRLVAAAEVPEKQTFPNKAINLICGFVFGLLFAILAAFFVESIDKTIKDPKDLKKFTNLNYLGTILKSRDLNNKKIISRLDPLSPEVEAFRDIRNGIIYASVDKPLRTIAVTSSIAEEGATSVAANLAIMFSMEGRNVILVDLNLRTPKLAEYFELTVQKGITDVLTDRINIQNAITQTGVTGVDILLSGPVPSDPIKLINSQKLKDILSTLAQIYDVVLLDVPPTIPVNDSLDISRYADGTILVMEASRATFSMVEQTLMKFEKARLNLIGSVINKKQNSGSIYYNYFPLVKENKQKSRSKIVNYFSSLKDKYRL